MSTKPVVQDEMILLVDIDEDFVEGVGGYPIPRGYYGDMISRTSAIPGITVLMPDPDIRGIDEDYSFRGDLEEVATVLAFTASTQATDGGPHVGTAALGENPRPWLFKYPGILRQLPVLAEVSEGVGLITTAPEVDGLVRRIPLVVNVQDNLYPTFALEMLRVGTGDLSYQIITKETGVEAIRIPSYPIINTDPYARVWTTWNTQFYRQSAADYLKEPIAGATFVVFGVTAEGVANPVPTPCGNLYPQHIQAHMLQNFVDGSNIQRSQLSSLIELLIASVTMLLVALAVYRLPLLLTAPIALSILGGIAYFSVYKYTSSLVLLDATFPVLSGFLVFTQAAFNNFYKQFKLREQIKKQFEHYLAPAMVKKLQKDPSLLRLGGDTRTMTYLFSDIRGFTPISEQFKTDPQGLGKLINRYMTPMTDLVMRKEGTIDKYIGDALMAIWNAPLDVDNHAQLAIETAQEMEVELKKLNKELKEDGLMELGVGIGINTGDAVVGNMGSNQRFDYTVLGDSVNLAARLEAQTRNYKDENGKVTPTLYSSYTQEKLENIKSVEVDKIKVKGKEELITIYKPI